MKNYLCDLAKSYMDQIVGHILIKQLNNHEW